MGKVWKIGLVGLKLLRYPFVSLLVIGMMGGFSSGLLGLGGAFLIIPPMISWLGMDRHRAHATALTVMFFTSTTVVLITLGTTHLVTPGIIIFPAVGSVAGVAIGTRIMRHLSGRWLGLLFSFFLLSAALDLMAIRFMPSPMLLLKSALEMHVLAGIIGLVAGIVSGSLGVGSGAIVIPLAITLLGCNQLSAQGISLVVVASVSFAGGFIHWTENTLDKRVLGWLIAGGMGGAVAGIEISTRVPTILLQVTLIGTLLAIGFTQLRTTLQSSKYD